MFVGAVGGPGFQQVPVLGSDALRVAVCDRREQQELPGRQLEPLFTDAALTQQHPLATVQQRVHHRAPLLQRGHRCGQRHLRAPGNRVVVSVTSATAASNGSALAVDGCVMPLTLRTYWRATAAISSAVAASCNPRSSVMFRHIPQR